MNVLGIDPGLAKTGVARGVGRLAQPISVIREKNITKLARIITSLAKEEGIQTVVIGRPIGEIEKFAQKLGKLLSQKGLRIEFWDETLTTRDAQRLAIETGMGRAKRKALEDAFSAALMLQSYLDHV